MIGDNCMGRFMDIYGDCFELIVLHGSGSMNVQTTLSAFQGMIALRREATELSHEDYMDAILEVNAKKKANLNYYA